jgi:hypothetical protein
MARGARIRRAVRYAIGLAHRAIPLSWISAVGAAIYPLCVQRGVSLLGARAVGEQVLYWSFALALGAWSQAIAARAVGGPTCTGALGIARWVKSGLALTATAAGIYAAFAIHSAGALPRAPPALIVSAAAFIFSDPVCFFFCPPTQRTQLALGTGVAALLVGTAVVARPSFMLQHFSVCGPSAIVAVLRMLFITERRLRPSVAAVTACLAVAFAVSAWSLHWKSAEARWYAPRPTTGTSHRTE